MGGCCAVPTIKSRRLKAASGTLFSPLSSPEPLDPPGESYAAFLRSSYIHT